MSDFGCHFSTVAWAPKLLPVHRKKANDAQSLLAFPYSVGNHFPHESFNPTAKLNTGLPAR